MVRTWYNGISGSTAATCARIAETSDRGFPRAANDEYIVHTVCWANDS